MTCPVRLGILLSGRGSNFLAIHQAIRGGRLPGVEIGLVLSNKEDAGGLTEARKLGYPAEYIASKEKTRAAHETEMAAALQNAGVGLICLAGYMRVLTPVFINAFPEAILNIHPSLLPSFPGLEVQKAALENGVKIAGCTVHFVDEAVDHGVIVVQRAVNVLDSDTPETLAARILIEEHLAYPEAIARVVSGRYRLLGRRYVESEEL